MIREVIMLGAVTLSFSTLDPIVVEMGQKYGVDPALIKAHIKAESNWDINASRYEAHKGDASWGLMQVLLSTAKQVLGNTNLTTTQLIQPRVNIEAGTKFIAQQLARYKGNIKDAIAAYNAGSAKIVDGKYFNQAYVDKVYNNYLMYKNLGFAVSTEDIIPTAKTAPTYLFIGLGVVALTYVFNNRR